MPNTIFTQIINNEVPSHKIYEDADFIAILDIKPMNPGHVLVIPKMEIDYLFDLPQDIYTAAFELCRKISYTLKKVTNATKIGLVVYGFDVSHAHIHLIPLYTSGDLDFSKAKLADSQDLDQLADKIKMHLF